jgi:hypothetical protein
VEIEDTIWGNFVIRTSSKSPRSLRYSKDSESIELNEIFSNRLIVTPIANLSELKFGQEVLYGDL